jgi:hypothetical protein
MEGVSGCFAAARAALMRGKARYSKKHVPTAGNPGTLQSMLCDHNTMCRASVCWEKPVVVPKVDEH